MSTISNDYTCARTRLARDRSRGLDCSGLPFITEVESADIVMRAD